MVNTTVSNSSSLLPALQLEPCLPPWWARGGHPQTIWGHIIKSPTLQQSGEKLEIPLRDHDKLVAFFHNQNSEIIVSLFHGLASNVDADYMHRTALLCEQMGLSCLRVNHRGSGDGAHLAKYTYHSGKGSDISDVISFLIQKYPGKKHIAVGFSMSGNMLLHLLSGLAENPITLPQAGIVVNGAINLEKASNHLQDGLNRIYDLRFVRNLSQLVSEKQRLGYVSADLKVPRFATVAEFDDLFTAPYSGFENRKHYYESCSTKPHVHKIKTPTYVLTAKDDPFIPVDDYNQAQWSKYVSLHIEPHGGHLGFLSAKKNKLGSCRWLDYYLFEALSNLRNLVS